MASELSDIDKALVANYVKLQDLDSMSIGMASVVLHNTGQAVAEQLCKLDASSEIVKAVENVTQSLFTVVFYDKSCHEQVMALVDKCDDIVKYSVTKMMLTMASMVNVKCALMASETGSLTSIAVTPPEPAEKYDSMTTENMIGSLVQAYGKEDDAFAVAQVLTSRANDSLSEAVWYARWLTANKSLSTEIREKLLTRFAMCLTIAHSLYSISMILADSDEDFSVVATLRSSFEKKPGAYDMIVDCVIVPPVIENEATLVTGILHSAGSLIDMHMYRGLVERAGDERSLLWVDGDNAGGVIWEALKLIGGMDETLRSVYLECGNGLTLQEAMELLGAHMQGTSNCTCHEALRKLLLEEVSLQTIKKHGLSKSIIDVIAQQH